MGAVWVGNPESKRSLYELDDVEYCWECGLLYLAKPKLMELPESE